MNYIFEYKEYNKYEYQVRLIDIPIFYKRKKGEDLWEFTTEKDFITNVRTSNLVDWKPI